MDYSNEGFILPVERDNVKGYASINSVLYRDEDGLDVTGNYSVYLLDPTMGSTHFDLEIGTNDTLEIVGGAIWVNDDIVQEIIQAIEMRKKLVESRQILAKN